MLSMFGRRDRMQEMKKTGEEDGRCDGERWSPRKDGKCVE